MNQNKNWQSAPRHAASLPSNEHLAMQRRLAARRAKRRRQNMAFGAIICVIAAIAIVLIVLLARAHSPAAALKGVWRYDEVTVYEFDGKNSGVLHTAINDYSFSYKIKGETLTLDFESAAAKDSEYRFVLNGDILTLTQDELSYILRKE